MKNKTITLEASRAKDDTLRINVYQSINDGVYKEKIINFDEIKAISRKLIDTINKVDILGYHPKKKKEDIIKAGTSLCDLLLFSPIHKSKLSLNINDNYNLRLKIDDRLVHIPWELIYLGDLFLCERFNMGRIVDVSQNMGVITKREIKAPVNMWLIANPQDNLAGVEEEVQYLDEMIIAVNHKKETVKLSVDNSAFQALKANEIKSRFRSYDIVHFAGHADYDKTDINKSGWKLSDDYFTPNDVKEMIGSASMPALIYANTCQSARTDEWSSDNYFVEMAQAFRLAGVRHYIGTFWEVMDKPSNAFSVEFYKNLFLGCNIGESVKKARQQLIKFGDDFTWASYVLYGDPEESYIDHASFDFETDGLLNVVGKFLPGKRTSKWYHPSNIKKNIQKIKPFSNFNQIIVLFFFTIIAVFLINLYYIKMKNDHDLKEKEFLEKQDKSIDAQVKSLFNDIINLTGQSPYEKESYQNENDTWSSKPLKMAIIYDAQKYYTNRMIEDCISVHLEQLIIKKTRLILLCRMQRELLPVLKEYLRKNFRNNKDLNSKSKLYIPKLSSANLFLYVSLLKFENSPYLLPIFKQSSSFIAMRLIDSYGILIKSFLVSFDEHEFLYKNKDSFSNKLIKYLNDKYLLRGKINQVNNNNVELNIGYKSGVDLGQLFKTINHDLTLTVSEVSKYTSLCKIKKNNTLKPQKTWKVECISSK